MKQTRRCSPLVVGLTAMGLLLMPGKPSPAGDRAAKADIGEDLGKAAPRGDELWQRVAEGMRSAQQRIRSRDTSAGTQRIQRQIVADLTALIENAEQRKDAAASASQGEPGRTSRTGQRSAPTTAKGAPSETSDSRTGTPDSETEKGADGNALAQVWGQLPKQLQRSIQSPLREQFLPQYEKLISEYYKRLAEGK